MIDVLMIESGDGEGIFQEIAEFLSTKTQCRVVNLQTHSDQTAVDDTLSFRNLEIRPKERTVYRDGKSVVLSHYEFSALLYLAQPPNWVFSKEQIYIPGNSPYFHTGYPPQPMLSLPTGGASNLWQT